MPSKGKRIGSLPSSNFQEIINNIRDKEKLSQSEVVEILDKEALITRVLFDLKNSNSLIEIRQYRKENNLNNFSFKYSDQDEVISDTCITYNRI